MGIRNLLDFLNNTDPRELDESLNELGGKSGEIFRSKGADIEKTIVERTKNMKGEEFVWFCFLRGNFLRGRDVVSNKAFKQFIEHCEKEGHHNYYFDGFPGGNLLPMFKPRFREAAGIERVLQQLRDKYGSGREFVIKEIERPANSIQVDKIHELYLELVARFMSYEQVGSKIANAIIDDVREEIVLLSRYNEIEAAKRLLESEWVRKLALASFFNVMIDRHVREFFREKLGIKEANHSILIFMGRSMKPEVIKSLLERDFRRFRWIDEDEEELLLSSYREYVGACMLEKVIWLAYFVKKNSKKSERISDLKFFKLSGDIFL
jgi:hypothetical protein